MTQNHPAANSTDDASASINLADLDKGAELHRATFALTRADLIRYAGASGDFNPIHWSDSVAQSVGLPGVIAHGMLTQALAGRAVTEWCGDAGRVAEFGSRFTGMIPVPDGQSVAVDCVVTCHAVDTSVSTVTVNVAASVQGEPVLGKARATIRMS